MADERPIIIKRVKKVQGGGHHGGAWKVAYADFVTAMMAFFLLLWLLGTTDDVKRKGLADYFTPTLAVTRVSTSGAGGVLGGTTVTPEGSMKNDSSTQVDLIPAPLPEGEDAETMEVDTDNKTEFSGQIEQKEIDPELDNAFEQVESSLKQAINIPKLEVYKDSVKIDKTPEGIRIQLMDQDKVSMFPPGQTSLYPHTRDLLTRVAQVMAQLPNQLAVTGHADADGLDSNPDFTVWELSVGRANAARRALVQAGLPRNRIAEVVGKGDREPLEKDMPHAAQNRRVSVILLREKKETGPQPVPDKKGSLYLHNMQDPSALIPEPNAEKNLDQMPIPNLPIVSEPYPEGPPTP